MHQVVVTFDVETREQAVELEAGIIASLSQEQPGGGAAAPWIPGSVLRDITEWSVDVDAED